MIQKYWIEQKYGDHTEHAQYGTFGDNTMMSQYCIDYILNRRLG